MEHRKRGISTGLIGLSLGAVALILAACGGSAPPGVAKATGSSTSTTLAGEVAGNSGGPPTQAQLASMTKFAECVRKHGFTNFPDPPYRSGELNNLGFYKGSPQMGEAERDCHALAVASGWVETKAESEYWTKYYLKISECMRVHGVPNFPDPPPSGGVWQFTDQAIFLEPNYPHAAKVCGAPPAGPSRAGAPRNAG